MSLFRPLSPLENACAVLGLTVDSPAGELQGAFQRALATARGRDGQVPPEQFREILEAYRILGSRARPAAEERHYETWPSHIELTPAEAITGGMKVGRLPTGRPFETKLPAGLRNGDVIWVWGWLLQVKIDEGDDLVVSGDDVWITVRRARASLAPGMRLALDLPTGPFSFRLTQEAIDAGLARAPGFGLPARKKRPQGDLYVRLLLEDRRLNPAEMFRKLTKAA